MIQYRTSDDGGATWQDHDPPFDPDAMHWVDVPDLAITPLGAIWLIYNGHIREGEHGLLSQVSTDDGETWSPQTRIQDAFCCQHIAGTTTGLVLCDLVAG